MKEKGEQISIQVRYQCLKTGGQFEIGRTEFDDEPAEAVDCELHPTEKDHSAVMIGIATVGE